MKKAIIFGSNGQDGFYLTQLLRLNNIEVICVSRNSSSIIGDVKNFEFVKNLIKKIVPDYVFHFAAKSSTNHDSLFDNHNSISLGTLNILESIRLFAPGSKVFLSGSALQFKNEGIPINENTPFESRSAYSAERIYSVYLARYYREKFNIKIYIGYLFNHDSPHRSELHFNQKIIKIASQIKAEKLKNVDLGNLNIKKEFNFAGDIVKAIWILLNQDIEFEVVIGSGISHSLADWVKICFQKFNLNFEKHVLSSSNYSYEYDILVSNPKKIYSLGWVPLLNMSQLAELMVENYIKNE